MTIWLTSTDRMIINHSFHPIDNSICSMPLLMPERRGKNSEKFSEQLRALEAEHAALNTAETAREQELDLLRHQVNEIASANLSAEEEAQIESRYRLASNSRRLIEIASGVATKLSEADDAILSQLG